MPNFRAAAINLFLDVAGHEQRHAGKARCKGSRSYEDRNRGGKNVATVRIYEAYETRQDETAREDSEWEELEIDDEGDYLGPAELQSPAREELEGLSAEIEASGEITKEWTDEMGQGARMCYRNPGTGKRCSRDSSSNKRDIAGK